MTATMPLTKTRLAREGRHDEGLGVLRWEEPPPSRGRGSKRRPSARYSAIADELRARRGDWGVIYEGPKGHATGLMTLIRTGAIVTFAPAGDFDACSRFIDDQRVIYARYLGDGDE